MKPTLKSLAAELSIDPSLISRVLRGTSTARISEAKRQLILDTARRVGYRPDRLAKSLKSGATRIVAMVVPDITNPFHSLLFRGVEKTAREGGFSNILYHLSDADGAGTGLIESLAEGFVDGFLIASALSPDPRIDSLRASGLPCVLLNRKSGNPKDLWIGPDDYRTGAMGAEVLAEHGHRRIAILLGDLRLQNMRDRAQGFKDTAKRLGLSSGNLTFYSDISSQADSKRALQAILGARSGIRPTAIFSSHTLAARAAFEECFKHGISVPQEMSLLGYSAEKDSPMSSIFVPAEEMGASAMTLLINMLSARGGNVAPGSSVPPPFQPTYLTGQTLARLSLDT